MPAIDSVACTNEKRRHAEHRRRCFEGTPRFEGFPSGHGCYTIAFTAPERRLFTREAVFAWNTPFREMASIVD
jgi:hypothetical protein